MYLGKVCDQVSCDNYDSDEQELSWSFVIIMILTAFGSLGKVYDQVSSDNYDSDGQ